MVIRKITVHWSSLIMSWMHQRRLLTKNVQKHVEELSFVWYNFKLITSTNTRVPSIKRTTRYDQFAARAKTSEIPLAVHVSRGYVRMLGQEVASNHRNGKDGRLGGIVSRRKSISQASASICNKSILSAVRVVSEIARKIIGSVHGMENQLPTSRSFSGAGRWHTDFLNKYGAGPLLTWQNRVLSVPGTTYKRNKLCTPTFRASTRPQDGRSRICHYYSASRFV